MVRAEDLSDIYIEIADKTDVKTAITIYEMFRGQQVQFPQKLYSKKFMYRYIKENYNGNNVRELAQKFGYSDRRIRQMLKDMEITI